MFIYFIRKLIPHLIMPMGVVIILMLIQIFKKKKWPTYSSVLILWSFSTFIISNSLIKLVEYPWERISAEEAINSEGIVVLSGGGLKEIYGKKRIIEWRDPDRFFNGMELYKRKKSTRLFFTGGYNPLTSQRKSEGELYIEQALKRGIKMRSLYLTPRVSNTQQEAKELSKLFKLNNDISKRIILVTSAFHMHRAKKIFEREGFTVFPFPVDFKSNESNIIKTFINPYNWLPTAGNLSNSSRSLRELVGRVYYRVW